MYIFALYFGSYAFLMYQYNNILLIYSNCLSGYEEWKHERIESNIHEPIKALLNHFSYHIFHDLYYH